jgi:hypothetical protein
VLYLEQRYPWAGLAVAALGVLLGLGEGWVLGGVALAIGGGLAVWRFTHPRRFLVLEAKQTRLVLRVAPESARAAHELADRIDRAIASGELPSSPPMLP